MQFQGAPTPKLPPEGDFFNCNRFSKNKRKKEESFVVKKLQHAVEADNVGSMYRKPEIKHSSTGKALKKLAGNSPRKGYRTKLYPSLQLGTV